MRLMNLLAFIAILAISHGSNAAMDTAVFVDGFEGSACNPGLSCCQGAVVFSEGFAAGNNISWGGQWQESGNEVDLADIINGQARLRPRASGYAVARMFNPINEQDVDVTFTLYFEDASTQGIGFYVRSNGGYLQQTATNGQGYGVFVERFVGNQPGIGLWYENDGNEISFVRDYDPAYGLIDETAYRVRYQVFQQDNTNTRLRARIWALGDLEPNIWHVSLLDNFAPLQNTAGGIAVDAWSTQQNGQITPSIRVDDIEVAQL